MRFERSNSEARRLDTPATVVLLDRQFNTEWTAWSYASTGIGADPMYHLYYRAPRNEL